MKAFIFLICSTIVLLLATVIILIRNNKTEVSHNVLSPITVTKPSSTTTLSPTIQPLDITKVDSALKEHEEALQKQLDLLYKERIALNSINSYLDQPTPNIDKRIEDLTKLKNEIDVDKQLQEEDIKSLDTNIDKELAILAKAKTDQATADKSLVQDIQKQISSRMLYSYVIPKIKMIVIIDQLLLYHKSYDLLSAGLASLIQSTDVSNKNRPTFQASLDDMNVAQKTIQTALRNNKEKLNTTTVDNYKQTFASVRKDIDAGAEEYVNIRTDLATLRQLFKTLK